MMLDLLFSTYRIVSQYVLMKKLLPYVASSSDRALFALHFSNLLFSNEERKDNNTNEDN